MKTAAASPLSLATLELELGLHYPQVRRCSLRALPAPMPTVAGLSCRVRADRLEDALAPLHQQVLSLQSELQAHNAQLMPGALPPWLPDERQLRGLQASDAALLRVRFHAGPEVLASLSRALQSLLPLLPALCASSPRIDGQLGGWQDLALRMRLPMTLDEPLTGTAETVLPRLLFRADDVLILQAMDSQESVFADLALLQLLLATLCGPPPAAWLPEDGQWLGLLLRCMESGDAMLIREPAFLACWQLPGPLSGAEFWREMAERALAAGTLGNFAEAICNRLLRGSLASVITATPAGELPVLYRRLGDCLLHNTLLRN